MRLRRTGGLTAALVLGVLMVPAPAGASTASMSGTTLVISGGPEASDISFGVGTDVVIDAAGITAGPGMIQSAPTRVAAPIGVDWVNVEVNLGDGNDTFRGGWLLSANAVVHGGNGNDVIWTDAGTDQVFGDDGNDEVSGVGGSDVVDGGPGDDKVNGGPGDDQLTGGPGRDSVRADGNIGWEDGNDTLNIRDGEADQAQCGLGADIVIADAIDVIDGPDCESVDRAVPPPPPPPPPPPAIQLVLDAPARGKLGTLLSRGVRVACRFLGAGTYVAKLKSPPSTSRKLGLGRRTVVLATRKGAAGQGAYALRLKPTARYRARLRRARKVSLVVDVIGTNAAGRDRETARITFRR